MTKAYLLLMEVAISAALYINEQRPHASMELTIVSADGIDLQTFYANLI